ncbi:hypothetical protein [Desulfovibrio psychrotolerans]|uniref:Uncharacterized protein n=1 Tax=Desulfovibrio psychrotolerans TaxID=415242 RepID=A0A7J0BZU0_9BACT|nr:hypothetical protein [Desulfovibrio psychrotolerans]GFM38464.1 hypothetical protein DSM19430T_31480 [Desulfovibrio psychrotolerans]
MRKLSASKFEENLESFMRQNRVKKDEPQKQFTLRLSKEHAEKVKKLASQQGMTEGLWLRGLVGCALDALLDKKAQEADHSFSESVLARISGIEERLEALEFSMHSSGEQPLTNEDVGEGNYGKGGDDEPREVFSEVVCQRKEGNIEGECPCVPEGAVRETGENGSCVNGSLTMSTAGATVGEGGEEYQDAGIHDEHSTHSQGETFGTQQENAEPDGKQSQGRNQELDPMDIEADLSNLDRRRS